MAEEAAPGLLERAHGDTVLRASQVSRFAIASPSVAVSAGAAALLSTVLFAVFLVGPARLSPGAAAAAAFAGVLVPAALAAGAAYNFYSQIGGTITRGRCATLAVTDLVIVLVFAILGSLLPSQAGDVWKWSVLVGSAFASSVNMIVLAGTADPNPSRALAPALSLPAGTLAVFFALNFITPVQLYLGTLFIVVFAASAALWIRIVIAPFERNFEENGLELLHAVLDAWAGWSRKGGSQLPALGTLRMEAFFARHGQPREVRFDALLFRREAERKLLWLVPELHPGPYADLGGSDLPAKAALALDGVAKEVAVFHGPSTHDENPTGREQLAKLFAQVAPALAAAKGSLTATPSVRRTSARFTVVAQRFGDTLVLGQSRAPLSSDDIDVALGREIRTGLADAGFARVLILDGHNAVADDLGRIHAGSPDGLELKALCLEAAREVRGMREGPLSFGWHQMPVSQVDRFEYAIGSQGITAAVSEVDGQRTAWVLIDGNNLKAGLRADLLEALKDKAKHAEVFTTDNHAVNATMGADNEIGSRRDNVRLIAMVAAAVERAAADLKPAEVAGAGGEVAGVQVFGPGLTVKMTATINAAVSVMVPAYVATTAAAVLGCVALAALLT